MAESFDFLTETLRARVLRGLQLRTLSPGDRLPSARTLAQEFGVDFRAVLNAYRALSTEKLVSLRARGGVYVAAQQRVGSLEMPLLPEEWIVEVLTQALARSLRATDFHEWLRRCTETLRLRALVIAATEDQVYGLCRELREDFGLEAEGLTADRMRTDPGARVPIRRADLLVTTPAHAEPVRHLGTKLVKAVTVVDVNPDLLTSDWMLLLRQPVYAIVATEEFGRMLREFLAPVAGAENLRVLVFGRDDLGTIPRGAPTYVTQRVRASLDVTTIPGRTLPPARTIRPESARELLAFVVRSNIAALSAAAP